MEKYMLPCLTKKLMGIDCPGCGIQRATLLLFKGEFTAAFHMYPAIYPMALFFIFLILNSFTTIKNGEKIKLLLGVLAFLTAIINYVLKMFLIH
ncbi:DUF2752 domain-containing protein [Tamlana sp. 62-3]|uniref:DUF2752 domain-containing protein n=1 Tax=Neotamlana sargassicola TaxID=2883125 RepID=A0A9X1L6Z7_9FLAO|nr:DUF2752 domain-containing protein [Tamlana sargassicola]MCB4808281.1 DUF2752 domain-containing protein [Tamlana sargassicola]